MVGKYFDKLGSFDGKMVKIITDDGQKFTGICTDYMSGLDNLDGIASICIGSIELYENEIISIEQISANPTQMAVAV